MSVVTTVTDWETPVVDFKTRTLTGRHGRSHLRLVPDVAGSSTSPSVRITRRGRLAMTILLALVCAVGAFMGVRAMTAAGASAADFDTVTVQSGQTLSSIAQRAYPGLPVSDGIARIQLANELNTNQVYGGEQLRLPR